MSSRKFASKEGRRGQDSSDEESAIIPEAQVSSRLSAHPVRPRSSFSGLHRTSDSQVPPAPPPSSAGTPARRPRRLDRDRLFWTLIGNGNTDRTTNSRSRSSEPTEARGPRPTNFLDLLQTDQSVILRYPSALATDDTGSQTSPSVRYPALRNFMSRRSHGRVQLDSSRRATSANGRSVILLRSERGNEPSREAASAVNPGAMQPLDEDMEVQTGSPPAVESAEDYVETVIEVAEEPINMSATSMCLEEVVEVDPPSPCPAPAPAAPAAAAHPPAEVTPSGSTEEPTQQSRGMKRKRDPEVTGDTHETVSTLNLSLLRLLECPVCMEWMEPPVAQCRRGHLVCGACRRRLDCCPVCRAAFSSVRNRAMEQVSGILRYPCRHGCGREVRQARRARHEASCAWRRYACPLPACEATPPMPRAALPAHCQSRHPQHFKSGPRQRVSLRVNCEQHQHWVVSALGQLFHARVDVDVHTWGVLAHVAFVGPQNHARDYTYEVTVTGRHNGRKLVYKRTTHSDLENSQLNTSRQDCFHLTLDQALNFLRFKNEHSETDKTLDFTIFLAECDPEEDSREISDSSLGADSKP